MVRDLEIWRRLVAGVATVDDLTAIGQHNLGRRVSFLGGIVAYTTHEQPAMRTAALAALRGARGMIGVRAIVARLDDDDAEVRVAAVEALAATSIEAPARFAHALFHPREDVRKIALQRLASPEVATLAIYLRADAPCADLAIMARWPDEPLPLAFEMYRAGHIPARELLELFVQAPLLKVLAVLVRSTRHLETLVDALAAVPPSFAVLAHFVALIKLNRELRAGVVPAMRSRCAHTPALWGTFVAIEPRVLAEGFDPAFTDDIVEALFRFDWPIKLAPSAVARLLALTSVRADLALAAAVAGLLPAKRLAALAKELGDDAICERLCASDRGWNQICRLPMEAPARELAWLARIAKLDYKRYVALAARALALYGGKRLDAFVDSLPRRHRPAIFIAALDAHRAATVERIAALCKQLVPRVDRVAFVEILKHVLAVDDAGHLVRGLVHVVDPKVLAAAAHDLTEAEAIRVVAIAHADPPPRDREQALVDALAGRTSAAITAWRDEVLGLATKAVAAPRPPRVRRALTEAERDRIATCAHRDLEAAVAPALAGLVTGLTTALAARAAPAPSVHACVALVCCSDPIEDIGAQLDRFAAFTPRFETEVDEVAASCARSLELPTLAHARLWRWEAHGFALAGWIESGGALSVLRFAQAQTSRFVRHTLWKGISEALVLLRYRARERFAAQASTELAQLCAALVADPIGRHAARIAAALVESGAVPIDAIRAALLERAADADEEAREYVARLVSLRGLPPPPPIAARAAPALVDQVRASTSIDELAAWCRDPRADLVTEAALALCALGPAGQLRLATLLADADHVPTPIPILQTVALWDHEPALDAVRALADDDALPPVWQFHLGLVLLDRGERARLPRVLAALCARPRGWHFRAEDWDALIRSADLVACSLAAVRSLHHHAYQRAVGILMSLTRPGDDVHHALASFLEVGDDRPFHLRIAVARELAAKWKDPIGVPILADQLSDEHGDLSTRDVSREMRATLAELVVSAALVGGPSACGEKRMWTVLQNMRGTLPRDVQAALDLRIFEHAMIAATRRAVSGYALAVDTHSLRVDRVAQVFAWGVKRGVKLTGGLYRIHTTAKEKDFGHTRLDTNRIFVSPLPLLRGEPHGQDIVEGLILHELGHHVYHRGAEAKKLWKQAHDEGIGHFLNLIADEHLERNLRGLDPSYGDRLKRLGAYAFQHAPQEIKVSALCAALGVSTAHALIHGELEVAFDEEAVRVRRGAILAELDRNGHPVARFSRALRMGLGNRAGDPLTAQALALCGKELRTLDMRGLYELTKRLVELFGGQVEIAKVFGGPEGLAFGERDDDTFGVDDDVLQREVERILDPRRTKSASQTGVPNRLVLNVNPDTGFEQIRHVQRVRGDAELHEQLATQVRRHATRLRGYLDELGLRWLPIRARTQGRALDRTRLTALVTRNDPRILIARTPTRKTDLFLGTIVDCSSSMSAGQNIERAKKLAILVAEAVRPLPGVHARFFGFTDSVIYDAGDAHDCNVVALQANGGNNDAAALYHAANVALAAPQRAKVLVMISDGLPTECSVAALRALVIQLTKRRGIVCAQVAVRRLEEVCFPSYFVLDDREPDVAVAKFGRMIGELARRSLAS